MEIFAILAGFFCTVSFIPQVMKLKRGDIKLSRVFLILYAVGVLNWGVFALTFAVIHIPLAVISFVQLSLVLALLKGIPRDER